jgi:hypothetical protein
VQTEPGETYVWPMTAQRAARFLAQIAEFTERRFRAMEKIAP